MSSYPWTHEWSNDVGPHDDYYFEFFEIRDAESNVIGQAEWVEDARIMSAAPELLEALEFIVKRHEPALANMLFGEGWVESARKVIAKARGIEQ